MESTKRVIGYFLLIITPLIFLISCNNGNRLVEPGEGRDDFGIYFLKDSTVKIDQLFFTDIKDLELASIPWISSKDIDFYDWSSHCIYLKRDKSYLFPGYKTPYTIPQSWLNKPYVVVADRVPSYLGYFKSDDLVPTSYLAGYPYITSNEINNYPEDVFATAYYRPGLNYGDSRNFSTVKEAINKLGLLREGINVSITDSLKITNGDTAIVRYTLSITNNEKENLYIFDPYKTQEEYYNYYNTGLIFRDYSFVLYSADNRKRQKPASWNSGWYTLLKAGENIVRTITLKGYKTFPQKEYTADTQYCTPTKEVSKSIRNNANGRYWIGAARTNILHLKID